MDRLDLVGIDRVLFMRTNLINGRIYFLKMKSVTIENNSLITKVIMLGHSQHNVMPLIKKGGG